MITYDDKEKYERMRRTTFTDCNPQYECCKRSLEIDMTSFLASANIIHPEKLDVGFCYGYCGGKIVSRVV